MDNPIDYSRTAGLVSDSTEILQGMLQQAYQMGFVDGANHQHREQSNLFQSLAVDYTRQVDKYQQELNRQLSASPPKTDTESADVKRIRPVPDANG